MSNPLLEIDIQAWVERARDNAATYKARQATEVVLNAIAHTDRLNQQLYLKGGLLMGLAYDSPRQTTDIDLTTNLTPGNEAADAVVALLDNAFPKISAKLGYAGLVLKVHSMRGLPRGQFETAQFPALKLKVGYADRGTPAHQALEAGTAATTIEIDISFNEPLSKIQILSMPEGAALSAYSLTDLMAEKLRAMLQQVPRRRNRRQDVYDLDLLIARERIDDDLKRSILSAFLEKSHSRDLAPSIDSLDDKEIKRRSGAEWNSLEIELETVPEFEPCYERVQEFYRSLPWGEV